MNTNAVIYARFSSDRQREESIEGQLRECKEYAARNGIRVIDSYIDRALSASKDTDKRLDFQRMIRDSNKHLFDMVLVWKLDRFARNRYDSAHYKNILKKNGVRVVSATEHITEGPEGIILESMLEGMAEYYSAELSEKIHRGQKDNALKGRNNGGRIPLGFKLGDDKRLEIDPVTAPIVQEIFKRYAEGETIRAIVNDLNNRGLKTSRGYKFAYPSFNTLLQNRKYIGEYKYQDVVIPGGIPAIVDEDTFNRVQARMSKNKQAPATAKAKENYLLTTKLFCGNCGKIMFGESGTGTGGNHPYFVLLFLDWKYRLDRAWYLGYEFPQNYLQVEYLDEMPDNFKRLQRQALDLLTHIWVTDTSEKSVDEKMTAYYLKAEQAGEDVFRFRPQKMSYELMYRETFAEFLCPDTVYDLIDYHLRECLKREIRMRPCKNCGRLFAVTGHGGTEYCDRPVDEKGRTCKEVGAFRVWEKSKSTDEPFKVFRREYKKRFAWIKAGRITKDEFYTWSERARAKRDECDAGKLTLEEFETWLRSS